MITREEADAADAAVVAAWNMPQANSHSDPEFWEIRHAKHAAIVDAYGALLAHAPHGTGLYYALLDAYLAQERKRDEAAEYAEKRRKAGGSRG